MSLYDENSLEELKKGEIHLYFAFPAEIKDARLLEKYDVLMNAEEKIQQQKFYFEKHRHQYIITRALIRSVLSRYAEVLPEDWQFSKNEYGRPEIEISGETPPLRFNLSHTDGLISCGIVLGTDIGVDVEEINRMTTSLEIAERFFSTPEVRDLSRVPKANQQNRFFDYWTLKESYIKARGMGLSLPLDQFSFHLSKPGSIGISFDEQLKDNPADWSFWLFHPTPNHKATVAVRQKTNLKNCVSIRKIVPLLEIRDFEGNLMRQSDP